MPRVKQLLQTLRDENVKVRRAALLTINTMVRNKPDFVRGFLQDGLLADIYEESKVKPELQRKINFGPFVHRVDEGLDNRQAAYECLDTILDECNETVDP